MHPDNPLSLLVGALIIVAFVGLAICIVRTTPAGSQARVLTAATTLMACIPAVLFAFHGR